MSAIHSDCLYAIRGDRVPVAGARYTRPTFTLWHNTAASDKRRTYTLKEHTRIDDWSLYKTANIKQTMHQTHAPSILL